MIVLPTMRGLAARLAYRSAVMADNPTAYWRLGEASSASSAADEKGAYAGTYVGNPTMGAAGAIAGNSAITLDAVDDYVDLGDSNAFSTEAMTIEFWAKPRVLPPSNSSNRMWTTTKGDPSQYEYEASINGASTQFGKWAFVRYLNLSAASYRGRYSSIAAVAGVWQHVVFTTSSFTALPDCYINGVLVNGATESNGTGTLTNGTIPLKIGRRGVGVEKYFDGSIDEVAIYPTALSPDRILAHYNSR